MEANILLAQDGQYLEVALPDKMKHGLTKYLRSQHKKISQVVEPTGLKGQIINRVARAEIPLIGTMAKKVTFSFLEIVGSEEKYNCVSFAHDLNGLPHTFNTIDWEIWNYEYLTPEKMLNTGDTVLLLKNNDTSTHMAVYLAQDLFLSKFGRTELIVTDLPNMLIGFKASQAIVMSPKPQNQVLI